jgi:hypothetical protein
MVKPLEAIFPALKRGAYRVTSPVDRSYNCIAYAAGDMDRWWWPLPVDIKEIYWPTDVTRAETIAAFREAFASLGFVESLSADPQAGYEKIALFANDQAFPLHAARQQPNGRWTSKLGELEDIDHALHDLEGPAYGKVVLIMHREVANP